MDPVGVDLLLLGYIDIVHKPRQILAQNRTEMTPAYVLTAAGKLRANELLIEKQKKEKDRDRDMLSMLKMLNRSILNLIDSVNSSGAVFVKHDTQMDEDADILHREGIFCLFSSNELGRTFGFTKKGFFAKDLVTKNRLAYKQLPYDMKKWDQKYIDFLLSLDESGGKFYCVDGQQQHDTVIRDLTFSNLIRCESKFNGKLYLLTKNGMRRVDAIRENRNRVAEITPKQTKAENLTDISIGAHSKAVTQKSLDNFLIAAFVRPIPLTKYCAHANVVAQTLIQRGLLDIIHRSRVMWTKGEGGRECKEQVWKAFYVANPRGREKVEEILESRRDRGTADHT